MSTGMTAGVTLLEGVYAQCQKVSDTEMERLNIEYAEGCAQWNYTLPPCRWSFSFLRGPATLKVIL